MVKNIIDISHHNTITDWNAVKENVSLAIIRVQYGSTTIDRKYKEFVEKCVQYGIPFGHYAYTRFVNVADAIVEAKDFIARADKRAKFLVVDVEEQTCKKVSDLVPASQAFIDTCKAAGWKVGLYTGHSFYKQYGMSKVKADFLWIPRYSAGDAGKPTGAKPDMACDMWQYTERGSVPGIKGNVDLNQLMGDKPLEWYTGETAKVAPNVPPATSNGMYTTNPIIAQVRVRVDGLRYRTGPGKQYASAGTVKKGKVYNVTANIHDWHEIIIEDGKKGWVYGNNGEYLEFA